MTEQPPPEGRDHKKKIESQIQEGASAPVGTANEPQPILHFVVERYQGDAVSVQMFRDPKDALRFLEACERDGGDVVLLGSDSLDTLLVTHASWFPGTRLLNELASFR